MISRKGKKSKGGKRIFKSKRVKIKKVKMGKLNGKDGK